MPLVLGHRQAANCEAPQQRFCKQYSGLPPNYFGVATSEAAVVGVPEDAGQGRLVEQ